MNTTNLLVAITLAIGAWATQYQQAAVAQPSPDAQVQPRPPAKTPANWTHVKSHSYEEVAPGYGFSHSYRSEAGTISVYIYTLGFSDWTAGTSDTRIRGQMDEVIGAIRAAEKRGIYRNVDMDPTRTVRVGNRDFLYSESRIEMSGERTWSAAMLTVNNGKLLKLRMSTGRAPVEDPRRTLFAFVEEIIANWTE